MNLPSDIYDIAFVNGRFLAVADATISVFDRGFLVADGIFETIYVDRGAAIQLEAHLERFARSAAFIRLHDAPSPADLVAILDGLLARNGLAGPDGEEAVARLTVSRGVSAIGPATVVGFVRRLTSGHLAKRTEGVLGFLLPFTRHAMGLDLTQHKTLAYLASSLGQILLAERTPDPRAEGFFIDGAGCLLEGASSNLFIVEAKRRLVTPPVSQGVLPGTSRAVVIGLAQAMGLEVIEDSLNRARVAAADEVFITSSTLRVAPVVALEDAPVGGGCRGAVVIALQQAYQARIDAEVALARNRD